MEVETVHFDSSEATYNEEGSDKFINDDFGGEEFPYATRLELSLHLCIAILTQHPFNLLTCLKIYHECVN